MLGLFGPKRDKSGPTERLLSTRGAGQEGASTASRVVNEVVVEGALQHQLALGRLDELDFGCSRPVRSVFVALSCLDTLWQEVSSRAIYVSDAVGGVLRSPFAGSCIAPVRCPKRSAGRTATVVA